ncbi:DUF6257 family protein [Streptomyces endophytica]|uniref:DUF6257 family protein n=1 Tax=Streptomyces endophytica TaxID=2991496 RepID=A0ABY6PB03_9ACTN|nr:DUF6257 family protein [Streptomyces endophytica]UZJ31003.1 DUF6257 family protein [Streptomyces endophytica]
MAQEPPLTAAEKAKVAYFTARMCKRSLAGEDVDLSDLQRKVDRVLDGAAKRGAKTGK